MKRSAARAFLIWLLAMSAGALVVWHSRFSADVSFFLPAHPSAEQQVLVDQLKEGTVARLLMLSIGGGDAGQRAELSRDLHARLAARAEFVSVQNGGSGSVERERDFLFTHRYLLSPAVAPGRFTVAGLRAAITDSIDLLTSPAGLTFKPMLTRDPSCELYALVSRLDPGNQPLTQAGVWASRDGEQALLLLQTRALGADTDGQANAIALIEADFAAARADLGVTDARLQLSGPGLFAVKSRALIKQEVERLSLISSLAIIAILFFVYRSPRLMLLGLLPVVSGVMAGVVAVSLVHGQVFGITIGFGAALIGEAVDYAIYFFVQTGPLGLEAWRQRFWPTVRLGVLTSLCGFGALLFSGFPGLAQLGLYALSGIFTAALVTRFMLPRVASTVTTPPPSAYLVRGLRSFFAGCRRGRLPVVLLAVLATAYVAAERAHLWSPNLSLLSTVSPAESELDGKLRGELGAPDARYMVVVTASSLEAALQGAEASGRKLDALVESGTIGSYDTPVNFLPSQATQTARRESLPARSQLRPNLQAAVAGLPLAASKLTPFLDDVEQARKAPLLTRADFGERGLGLLLDSLISQRQGHWSILLPLHPNIQAGQSDIPADAVRAALAGHGVLFLDMKHEFDQLYASYLGEAQALSLAGVAAILLVLTLSLRSSRRIGAVMLPLVLAVILTVAGLHLAGEQLHLLHLVGLLLIVAVGSNYALFFATGMADGQLDDGTLLSMAVANLTTVVGFGTLALSSVPVLHAIGVTVGPGALLALLLSATLAPGRAR
jgi:predicted exporter